MSSDKFFAAEINPHTVVIDLHTTNTVIGALEQLEKELFLVFNTGEKYCRVIHGIGTGILAEAVHKALSKNPLVADWQESEQGGSCLILF